MASSNDGGVDMVRTGDHAFIKVSFAFLVPIFVTVMLLLQFCVPCSATQVIGKVHNIKCSVWNNSRNTCNNSTSSADTKCIIFLCTLVQDMSFLKVAIATDYKKCHCCEFSLARETFFKSYFAWIMKKGSVYTQVINSRSVKDVLKGIMIMNKHLNNVLINICCINGAILISLQIFAVWTNWILCEVAARFFPSRQRVYSSESKRWEREWDESVSSHIKKGEINAKRKAKQIWQNHFFFTSPSIGFRYIHKSRI